MDPRAAADGIKPKCKLKNVTSWADNCIRVFSFQDLRQPEHDSSQVVYDLLCAHVDLKLDKILMT